MADVAHLWSACHSVGETSPGGRYLLSRGYRLDRHPWLNLVREAPAALPEPFAWWPAPWLQGWPLVFPAYDARGQLASLHARAVSSAMEPKTRWPYKCSASGLLFADGAGVEFLRGCATSAGAGGLELVVIVEGATDTLKLAQVLSGAEFTSAVLGYVAGSKSALAALDWPRGLPCLVATDDDDVGDKYAGEILGAVGTRTSASAPRRSAATSPTSSAAGSSPFHPSAQRPPPRQSDAVRSSPRKRGEPWQPSSSAAPPGW